MKNQSQHFRGGLRGNKKKNNKWKVCDYNGLSSTAELLNSYWKNVHEKELIYKISQFKKNQNQNVENKFVYILLNDN